MRDLPSTNAIFSVVAGRASVVSPAVYEGLERFAIAGVDDALQGLAFVVIRRNDDLVVIYADGTEVVVQDYFNNDTNAVLDTSAGVVELDPLSAPIGVVEGNALHAYSGPVEQAREILLQRPQFAQLEPLLDDDVAGYITGDLGAISWATFATGALNSIVGSGGGSLLSALNPLTVISGRFVAGPIIPGNGLVVDIYDAAGTLLASDVPLDANGSFSITLPGTIPNVIAILRDTNADPDYRDEATGRDVDLNANLAGIGAGTPQPGGTTTVSLNINPVTTVAARLAGIGADGSIPPGGITPDAITQSIATVQNSFGLSDINGVTPIDIFDDAFDDTDGSISEGEQYGQVLAMLSGIDKLNGGNQQTTVDELVTAIQGAGADTTAQQSAVRTELLAGAREFEFNNTDGTEVEADLLRSPSLGVERTPEIGTDGRTTEPGFSALLEDSLEGASTGDGPNSSADTIEGFQTLVDTADAAQNLAALATGAEIPADIQAQLTEENLTALGLTGLVAPSPYLDAFLSAVRDVAPEDADTVQELQDLLNAVVAASLTPTFVPGMGAVAVGLPATAETASVSYTDSDSNPQTLALERYSNGDWVVGGGGSLPEGFAVSGDTLTIQNTQLENGSTVTVSVADGAGNSGNAISDPLDTLAPPAATVAQSGGDVVVGLPNDDDAATASVAYTDAAGVAQTLELVRDPVADTWGPVTAPLPTGFDLTGDTLTIENERLQDGSAVTVTVADAAGNSAAVTSGPLDTTPPLAPTINQSITDQGNTISGEGEAGATVTVLEGATVIGTADVWTDGTWSFVADPGVSDGAVLTATQADAAGNVSPSSGNVTTFHDTDGDGTRNTDDTDADGDGITDANELEPESTFITNNTVTDAVATVDGAVTTGYSNIEDNSTASSVNIVATAPRENVSSPGRGSVSNFFIQFDTVETETLQNVSIDIQINSFDDGIFVAINGVTVVEFDELAWFDVNGGDNIVNQQFGPSGGRWQPWAGNGNPEFRIDVTARTVELLVDDVTGVRRDILAVIEELGAQNPTPNPVPVIDPEAGVTISTASANVLNTGFIDVQTITVSGEFGGLEDIDGDGIINSLDIDTDGDRIWDKYDVVGTDSDGIAAYRDTDSNGNGITDTVEASLTAADIAALVAGTSSARVDTGTYTNGDYSSQFILLTEAVDLDFTAINNAAIRHVEYIDMADGANAQTITIDVDSLIDMTDGDNELIIVGDAGDAVNVAGAVETTLKVSIQNRTHTIWELGAGRLIIDDEITVNLT